MLRTATQVLATTTLVGVIACGKVVGDPIYGDPTAPDAGQESTSGTGGTSPGAGGAAGAAGTGPCGIGCLEGGTSIWQASIGQSAPDAIVRALHTDEAGHVFVGGRQNILADDEDWLVMKLDSDGNAAWTVIEPDGEGRVHGVAVGSAGNPYTTGSVFTDRRRLLVVKYDTQGNTLWTHVQDDPSNAIKAHGNGVASGPNGVSVVTGYETPRPADPNADATNDIWIRKLDSTGAVVWTERVRQDGHDSGASVAIHSDGSVVAVGTVAEGAGTNGWIRKYHSDGNVAWTRTFDGPNQAEDDYWGVVLDDAGRAYVGGAQDGPPHQGIVHTYDADGTLARSYVVEEPQVWLSLIQGIARGDDGSVFACGAVAIGETSDVFVQKLDPELNVEWTYIRDEAGDADQCMALDVGPDGAVLVGGYVTRSDGFQVGWVEKLAP